MIRHRLDLTSLICGLVFAAVAVVYLVAENSNLEVDVRWALPLALIGLGVGGVVGAITSARRASQSEAATQGDAELVQQSE